MMGEVLTFKALNFLLLLQSPLAVPNTDQIAQATIHSHGRTGEEILVPIAVFTMFVLLAWLRLRQRQAQIQTATEFRRQLLDKFATGRELADFLETKAGQQFLVPLPTGSRRGGWQRGLIATIVGLAFIGLWFKGQGHYLVIGVLLLSLGIGILLSALISHRLAIKNDSTMGSGRDQMTPRQL